MSEKRFTLEQWTEKSLYFSDGEYSAHMSIEYICKEVEKKLNEQQATINKLKSDIEETEISIKLFEDDVNRLSKENEQLRQSVEYWQKKYEEGTETFPIN